MKRHVIYMSDEQWEALIQRSKEEHVTISEYVRRAMEPVYSEGTVENSTPVKVGHVDKMTLTPVTQKQRDEWLRKLSKEK
jgi:hypothetical protein